MAHHRRARRWGRACTCGTKLAKQQRAVRRGSSAIDSHGAQLRLAVRMRDEPA